MASSIHTRYASLADLPAPDPPAVDQWLSPAERRTWQSIHAAPRHATWLAGRMAAKRLLIERLADYDKRHATLTPAEIHIETHSTDPPRGQRPGISVSGRPLDWALSIAHTDDGVLVAVAGEPGVTLGVDLVRRQDRRTHRLAWCFTPAERRWLAAGPAHCRGPEQLWAMKEALYKACQQGEGFAPRRIEVVPGSDPCYPMLDSARAVRSLQSWRVAGHFAALAVAEPSRAVIGALRGPTKRRGRAERTLLNS